MTNTTKKPFSRAANRDEAIALGEDICQEFKVPLCDGRIIMACLGHGTYVLTTCSGKRALLSHNRVTNLIKAMAHPAMGRTKSLRNIEKMAEIINPVTGTRWQPDYV